jgi:hypothetical protein
MNEEQQQIPQPTMEQLLYALAWELQALRVNVQALNESVQGLSKALED